MSKGFVTVDFLFALVISVGITTILFTLTFTMTAVEIAQYIAYSSSRAYYAGHATEAEQRNLAQKKYFNLINAPAIKPLFTKGWLEVPKEIEINTFSKEYQGAEEELSYIPFVGTRIPLTIKIIPEKLLFFGETGPEGGFGAYVTSFIGREVTQEECSKFYENRHNKIIRLFSGIDFFAPKNYRPQEDNGC